MKTSTRQTRTRHIRRGFTLTELLIVMAILVLLVSLVGPRLLGSKQKADVNSVKTQIGMFQAALERYAIDMNRYPSTEEGLTSLVSQPNGSESTGDEEGSSSSKNKNWDGPYLKGKKLPVDPWGNSYGYEFPSSRGQGDSPDIWSFGPDGEENTEDDIVSWDADESLEGDDDSGEDIASTDN